MFKVTAVIFRLLQVGASVVYVIFEQIISGGRLYNAPFSLNSL